MIRLDIETFAMMKRGFSMLGGLSELSPPGFLRVNILVAGLNFASGFFDGCIRKFFSHKAQR